MRRVNGMEDFPSKMWADFKQGFGNMATDFWLGKNVLYFNKQIHYVLLCITHKRWGRGRRYRGPCLNAP